MAHLAGTRVALGIAAIVLTLTVPAGLTTGIAQAEDKNTAKEHWELGTKYYRIGKYDDAIKEFEAGYVANSDPAFLYNLAEAHRLAGHPNEAARLYRTYLRHVPKPPNRAEIERRIEELEKTAAEKPTTEPPATGATTPPAPTTTPPAPTTSPAPVTAPPAPTWPPPATTPEQPPSAVYGQPGAGNMPSATYPGAPTTPVPTDADDASKRRKLGLVIAGAGGGVMVVGAIFGLVARAQSNKVEEAATNGERFDPSVEKLGNAAEVIQWIGYGVGAAAVAAGLIVYATTPTSTDAQPRVAVGPLAAPGLGGALVRVAF